ncbi:MAG: glycyl-radical enzyme activating protein [Dorea sp.]|nr:glycyl-radical enzyme activating protein [Dorea sp.]
MSLITNIQRYSIHDGDGIRTTVFFKGCPLRCTWCHNPETQYFRKQPTYDREKCAGCGNCLNACPEQAITAIEHVQMVTDAEGNVSEQKGMKVVTDPSVCKVCGQCVDYCNLNLREICGKEYTVNELIKEVKKDEMFYETSGGGVTFSGGEVMVQDMDYLVAVCKKLHRYGISINFDTCGYAPYENFEKILPYADTFLYDIKAIDDEVHKQYMGVSNELILENLRKLSKAGAKLYIRIPTIKEVNGKKEDMKQVIDFLTDNQIRVAQINLLPYHNTGSGKYDKIGVEYEGTHFTAPTNEEMEELQAMFQAAGYSNTKIGG